VIDLQHIYIYICCLYIKNTCFLQERPKLCTVLTLLLAIETLQ
jgi:hypothetical protein